MLAEDIAKLMLMIPQEEVVARNEGKDRIEGGAFDGVMDKETPFMYQVTLMKIITGIIAVYPLPIFRRNIKF